MAARVIHGAQLPIRKNAAREFIADFEKLIIGDQLPYKWREDMQMHLRVGGKKAMSQFFENSPDLLNHTAQRPRGDVFAETLLDYLPARGVAVRIGSLISAIMLGLHNHQAFVFPKGVFWRYKAIMETTPFISYASKNGGVA
jgi:hypothetical protein